MYSKPPLNTDAIFASQLCVTVWRKRVNKDVRGKSKGSGPAPGITATMGHPRISRQQSASEHRVWQPCKCWEFVCMAKHKVKTQQVTAKDGQTSLFAVTLQMEKTHSI